MTHRARTCAWLQEMSNILTQFEQIPTDATAFATTEITAGTTAGATVNATAAATGDTTDGICDLFVCAPRSLRRYLL